MFLKLRCNVRWTLSHVSPPFDSKQTCLQHLIYSFALALTNLFQNSNVHTHARSVLALIIVQLVARCEADEMQEQDSEGKQQADAVVEGSHACQKQQTCFAEGQPAVELAEAGKANDIGESKMHSKSHAKRRDALVKAVQVSSLL